jgi:hypothetical protein
VCKKHGARVKVKRCSSEGCTNIAVKGGVCIRHGAKIKLCSSEGCTNVVQREGVCKRHGAKIKRCSSEGCTNQVIKGGVCWRHGAKRNPYDESTAFGNSHGSAYDETTVALSNQRTSAATGQDNTNTSRIPPQVIVCQVQVIEQV